MVVCSVQTVSVFGSLKMLNEILGRKMKQDEENLTSAAAAATPLCPASKFSKDILNNICIAKSGSATNASGGGSVDGGNVLNSDNNYSVSTNSMAVATGESQKYFFDHLVLGGSVSPKEQLQAATTEQQKQQQNDLAHQMLRNILQSKKDLIALDKELRSVINHHRTNNNANIKQNTASDCSDDVVPEDCSDVKIKSEPNLPTAAANTRSIIDNICNFNTEPKDINESSDRDSQNISGQITPSENLHMDSNLAISECIDGLNFSVVKLPDERPQSLISDLTKREAEDALEDGLMVLSSGSDSDFIGSPGNSDINDMMMDNAKGDPDEETGKDDGTTANKAAETIKPSPSSHHQIHLQVNGCKKRKLYQPQQHAMERYAAATAAGLNLGLNMQSSMVEEEEEEEDDIESEARQIQQTRMQKNALKLQLRTMQKQLAEMQQKNVQLCSRMEQESRYKDVDDSTSDSMENDVQQTVNPKTSILQHIPHIPEDHSRHVTHATMSNAAAMYLGQHFLLEQEVRVAKEAAEQLELQQQEQQRQHQRQQQRQQQQKQQQEQKEAHQRLKEQQQHQQRLQIQQREFQQREAQLHRQLAADARILESQTAASVENHLLNPQYHQRLQQPQQMHEKSLPQSSIKSKIPEKFNMLRSPSDSSATFRLTGSDLEGLADVLKSEITASLSALVDTIVSRVVQERRLYNKQSQTVTAAADQLSKDLLMASQNLERKSTQTKESDQLSSNSSLPTVSSSRVNSSVNNFISSASGNSLPLNSNTKHTRSLFETPITSQGMTSITAASLYNSIGLGGSGSGPLANSINPYYMPEPRVQNVEQNEALSLVVTPKKKRHKVTDTRITPRTVSRILAQDGGVGQNLTLDTNLGEKLDSQTPACSKNINLVQINTSSPHPSPYNPPAPPMMSVSLPTSVAITNPSLHETQVFSPYNPFYSTHHGPHGGSNIPPAAAQMHHMKMSSSPPGLGGILENRGSPPITYPPPKLHSALLAAQHRNSPDYNVHLRAAMDAQDRSPEGNEADMHFDAMQPTISFLKQQMIKPDSIAPLHASTLTPMHLRKAKLMFFWSRYPSSAVLKMYFPDIKFNKNNTAQLVKWFSNFREFYYIQMEKYARQAVTEGVKNYEDLHVGGDSELYRVLNLHYNRNNHIEVPSNFRFVVEQTLREFFRAIQGGKDTEQSWKKSIYKIISRMDDPVPEYFKSPNFLEQLE